MTSHRYKSNASLLAKACLSSSSWEPRTRACSRKPVRRCFRCVVAFVAPHASLLAKACATLFLLRRRARRQTRELARESLCDIVFMTNNIHINVILSVLKSAMLIPSTIACMPLIVSICKCLAFYYYSSHRSHILQLPSSVQASLDWRSETLVSHTEHHRRPHHRHRHRQKRELAREKLSVVVAVVVAERPP